MMDTDITIETSEPSNNKIEDFGEKIGGAAKDRWSSRTISIADIADMNHRELLKNCIKANVWAKPDYEKLVNEGMSPVTAYLVKKIYDSYPAKISSSEDFEKDKSKAQEYIKFSSIVSQQVLEIKDNKDIEQIFRKLFIDNGYYKNTGIGSYSGYWTDKHKEIDFITNKFIKALSANYSAIRKAERAIKENGFPYKQEAWKKNIEIKAAFSEKDKGTEYQNFKYTGKYAYVVLADGFKTKDEAETFLNNELKDTLKKKKSVEIVRPQLRSIKRRGSDYRDGRDVTTDDFMSIFGFRGGEFGNWNTQEDRQQNLNMAYDALMDLSKTMEINPKMISLDGKLAIAFGARGSGRKAAAHYESDLTVINLTKMNGAGSLAHEWAHAFDDYYGRLSKDIGVNKFASEGLTSKSQLSIDSKDAWKRIMTAIKERKLTKDEIIETTNASIEKKKKTFYTWLKPVFEELNKKGITNEELIDYEKDILDSTNKDTRINAFKELNEYYKEVTGRLIDKKTRDIFENWEYWRESSEKTLSEADSLNRRAHSKFYEDAINIDKNRSKQYYSLDVELFARAFETYIQDKITIEGNRSDYLVNGTNHKYGEFNPYPLSEERNMLFQEFDNFFNGLKELDRTEVSYTDTLVDNEYVNVDYKENNKNINEQASDISKDIEETTIDEETDIDENGEEVTLEQAEENSTDLKPVSEEKFDELEALAESYEKEIAGMEAQIKSYDAFKAINDNTGDYVIVSPSSKDADKIQVTYYYNDDPISDAQLDNMKEVVERLVEGGFYNITDSITFDKTEKQLLNTFYKGNVSYDELKAIEGKNFIIRINKDQLPLLENLNIPHVIRDNNTYCNVVIKTNDKIQVLEKLGLRDKDIGNISYDDFKKIPGKNEYMLVSNEEFQKLKGINIKFAAFDKGDKVNVVVKKDQLEKFLDALGRKTELTLGNIKYATLKSLPGNTLYRIYTKAELDKLMNSDIKFSAFPKGAKFNIAFKEQDLQRVHQLLRNDKQYAI